MANNEGIGAGGLLVAFIAGALTGAAVALLYAPATGEETREYLGKRAREGRDRAEDAARQGREIFERQRQQFTTAFERARDQVRQTPDDSGEQEA